MIITAKFESDCKVCGVLVPIGAQCGWKPGEKGIWCMNHVPDEVKKPPEGWKPDPSRAKLSKPQQIGTTTLLKALGLFEDALVERSSSPRFKMTDDIEKGWAKYSKLKAMALNPGTSAEGATALRMAIIEIVKLVL